MEDNFRCINCDTETFVTAYEIKFVSGSVLYYAKSGDELKCTRCKSKLIPIPKKGNIETNFAKFNALSPTEKQQSLRKRARLHGKNLLG